MNYPEDFIGKIINMDCLEAMKQMPDKCVDLVLTDPPYGTTACKWDTCIPFEPMWEQLKRITKKNGAIVLFGSQPFTSALVMSNPKMFKYEWVWNKTTAKGHLVAKFRPMQQTENISVFGFQKINYYPQKTMRPKNKIQYTKEAKRTIIMGGRNTMREKKIYNTYNPKNLLTFKTERGFHPTQKPVALMEYLIKTYTNKGELVLDFTVGSGTTAIAAEMLDRHWIGIEISKKYCDISSERLRILRSQPKML